MEMMSVPGSPARDKLLEWLTLLTLLTGCAWAVTLQATNVVSPSSHALTSPTLPTTQKEPPVSVYKLYVPVISLHCRDNLIKKLRVLRSL